MDNSTEATPLRSEAAAPLTSIPIEITVSVGRARPLVRDLLRLDEGSVLTLDKRVDDRQRTVRVPTRD